MTSVDPRRAIRLNDREPVAGPVIYWMSRDQRVRDNWALIYAREKAREMQQPLHVAFCLAPGYLGATERHYRFMLEGLKEVEGSLQKIGISFRILEGEPGDSIVRFAEEIKAGWVVTDFNPLRINRSWKEKAAGNLHVPLTEVDAHNIVPCRIASEKQEFGAYTLRPKIKRLLPEFLVEFEKTHLPARKNGPPPSLTKRGGQGGEFLPGEISAQKALHDFIQYRLNDYDTARNDPNSDGQSGLSPYLHFGQLSAQRVALEVSKADARPEAKAAFLEELIVRRELSDNFCFYNPHYDSFDGFHPWAKATLNAHRDDPRQYLYSYEELEAGTTHDPLWNAAQREMVTTGKMHGYMRMYWTKKILEWTGSPEEALAVAIHLNDTWSLDGRDPNGYAGIAWSIGGIHDRAWGERPVFGKIRYMNYQGCRRKFNVDSYMKKVTG
jgi:deoxyribodipyrimidine photo-lyase